MSAEQTPDIETVTSIVLDSLHYADHHGGMSMLSLSRHVAQALAPVLAAAVREAEQRALREAADDMEAIFRSGHLLGGPSDVWLRDRADRVAEPQHEAATSGKEAVSEPTGAVDWRDLPHVHAGTDCAGGPDCPARPNGEGA